MCKARAVLVLVAVLCGVSWADASEGPKRLTPKQAIKRRYDYNHNGRLGRWEQADARVAYAQLRQQRAYKRNARALSRI